MGWGVGRYEPTSKAERMTSGLGRPRQGIKASTTPPRSRPTRPAAERGLSATAIITPRTRHTHSREASRSFSDYFGCVMCWKEETRGQTESEEGSEGGKKGRGGREGARGGCQYVWRYRRGGVGGREAMGRGGKPCVRRRDMSSSSFQQK